MTSRKRSLPVRILRFAAALAMLGILLSAGTVLVLRWLDPPTSAFMVRDRMLAYGAHDAAYRFRHRWVDWKGISAQAKIAVMAAEDQKFPEHGGFDFASINQALEERESGRRVRGASTISQQVAKNLFLWPGQSWLRKGLEAYFTLLIEALWPKQRILEVYLNIAEFGRGTYGVEAAAQRFYRRPAKRLNREQSAMLAAVLPNPRRFRVEAPSRYVMSRRDWILHQMAGLGGTRYLDALDAQQDQQRN